MSLGVERSLEEADAMAFETDCICPGTGCQRLDDVSPGDDLLPRYPLRPLHPARDAFAPRFRPRDAPSRWLVSDAVTFQMDDRCPWT